MLASVCLCVHVCVCVYVFVAEFLKHLSADFNEILRDCRLVWESMI